MRTDKSETILYQNRSHNLLRAPSWEFISPSTQFLQNKVTLDQLQQKVSEINRVSQKAYNRIFIPDVKGFWTAALMSLSLAILLFLKHMIGYKCFSIWCTASIALGFLSLVAVVFRSKQYAIRSVKHYVQYRMHNSWSFRREITWNYITESDPTIWFIYYVHIVIRFEENKRNEVMREGRINITETPLCSIGESEQMTRVNLSEWEGNDLKLA